MWLLRLDVNDCDKFELYETLNDDFLSRASVGYYTAYKIDEISYGNQEVEKDGKKVLIPCALHYKGVKVKVIDGFDFYGYVHMDGSVDMPINEAKENKYWKSIHKPEYKDTVSIEEYKKEFLFGLIKKDYVKIKFKKPIVIITDKKVDVTMIKYELARKD